MLFSYCCGWQWNRRQQKWRQIAGNFDCHGDAAVRRGVHHPIEHVQGFTGSHWMPPLGKCLRRIALVAAMVNKFVETTQNTNKTKLLASNYGTFRALVFFVRISYLKTDPLLRSSMQRVSFKCETLRLELKSSRSFLAIKHCQRTKLKKLLSDHGAH